MSSIIRLLSKLQQLVGNFIENIPENNEPELLFLTISTKVQVSLVDHFISISLLHWKCGPPDGFWSQHKYSKSLLNCGSLTLWFLKSVNWAILKIKNFFIFQ